MGLTYFIPPQKGLTDTPVYIYHDELGVIIAIRFTKL